MHFRFKMSTPVGLNHEPLDDESLKVAEEELRETPERKVEALAQLRKLLEGTWT